MGLCTYHVYRVCAASMEAREGSISLETGVTGTCGLACGCWEPHHTQTRVPWKSSKPSSAAPRADFVRRKNGKLNVGFEKLNMIHICACVLFGWSGCEMGSSLNTRWLELSVEPQLEFYSARFTLPRATVASVSHHTQLHVKHFKSVTDWTMKKKAGATHVPGRG